MSTLNEVMKETADAIREKTGKSDLIAPVDFAEEIKSISVGGGESGGSEYEYFALTGDWVEDINAPITMFASLYKIEIPSGKAIFPTVLAIEETGDSISPLAIAIDMSIIVKTVNNQMTIKDTFLANGVTEEMLARYRITKEQFYDLNA